MKTRFVKMGSIVVGLVMCVCAKAQDVQMSTLQHGDNMTAYYGADAFKSAMAAAEDGDLISLSAGSFNATDITKAVKIQGAGYVQDAAKNRFRTTIVGDIAVVLKEGQVRLQIEGIWNDNTIQLNGVINQFEVAKSRLSVLLFADDSQSNNCMINQCRIKNDLFPGGNSQNLYVCNSIVKCLRPNSSNSTLYVKNCVITESAGGYDYNWDVYGTFENSILCRPTYNLNCSAYNNITNGNRFNTATQENNWYFDTWALSEVFVNDKTGGEADIDGGNFKLTDETAAQYLGTDGTQVGIYGGEFPFTDVPSNPQITSKQIASQSDANGKLSVKITVEAQK